MPSAVRGLTILTLCLAAVRRTGAQQFVRLGTELDDYLRYSALSDTLQPGPLVFRSPSSLAALTQSGVASGVRVDLLNLDWRTVYNSRYPRSSNDGALWAGRGASGALSAGARLRWGPLTAVLDPVIWYAQNRAFDLAPDSGAGINRGGLSPYAYAYARGFIDWPERFGDQALTRLDWGQSEIRLNLRRLTAGFSHENMWWGPAVQNPILMSNTSGGFPHADIGTGAPVWIGIGRLETRVLWGALRESAYFDTIPSNDRRLFVGVTLGLQPRWVPGLTLGAARVFYQTWDSLRVADFFDVFQTVFKGQFATPGNPQGNDVRDQMLSLMASWTLPKSGFNAYVEWARNDHNVNLRDLLVEPDHSRAYTIGFQQAIRSGDGGFRLAGEFTTLGVPATVLVRATPTYYEHYIVRQGYTQRGQLLGASIGPGSQSQTLSIERYGRNGRFGLFLQRVGLDNDAYYRDLRQVYGFYGNQTELTGALRGSRFLGPLLLSATVGISRELNRHYQASTDATNLMLDLRASWRLPR